MNVDDFIAGSSMTQFNLSLKYHGRSSPLLQRKFNFPSKVIGIFFLILIKTFLFPILLFHRVHRVFHLYFKSDFEASVLTCYSVITCSDRICHEMYWNTSYLRPVGNHRQGESRESDKM